ncbi:HNH endonuclease signature motif containing protein [Streptomyces sp. NPDC058700]|uniref:HNH endonuclease signature motif containing protein n=1 Tax=Streptomyces sp. NPDC058700 TaxID=3346607 RepID=UPI003653E536
MCISGQITVSTLEILQSYELRVIVAADAYERACRSLTLHQLNPTHFSPDPEKKDHKKALIDMYDQRMQIGRPGRPVYEEARNRKGKCPICGVGRVRQVDHHMPKAIFPYLATVPINLLPICSDCNREKLNKAPTCYTEQTLHPYFDEIGGDQWLRARLITLDNGGEPFEARASDNPQSWRIDFYVDPPSTWDSDQAERVKYHFFEAYKLNDIYEDQAADDLPGLELAFEQAFAAGGAPEVRASLEDLARSRARPNRNSWMVALYEGLAANDWFCSGGFHEVVKG